MPYFFTKAYLVLGIVALGPLRATFQITTANLYFSFWLWLVSDWWVWWALPSFQQLWLFLQTSCCWTRHSGFSPPAAPAPRLSAQMQGLTIVGKNFGVWHSCQLPLERWARRSWQPPKPGSLRTGSENRWGEDPLAREENILSVNINPFRFRDAPRSPQDHWVVTKSNQVACPCCHSGTFAIL